MSADLHSFIKMKWLLILSFIALTGLETSEACDATGMGRCQSRMMEEAVRLEGSDKSQVCTLLDKMRDCMIRDAGCPEDSIKEAFELIKPGLQKRFDIRCGCSATQASLTLLVVLLAFLLTIHK